MSGPLARPPARWRRLLDLSRPQWRGYALIWALTLASSGAALLQPWPVQVLIDHVLGDHPVPGWLAALFGLLPGSGSQWGRVAWVAIATLVLFALDAVIDLALTMCWLRTAQKGVYDLARRVFAKLLRRSVAFHAVTPVGDSLSRMTGDSWCVYNAATALLFTPFHALLVGGAMVTVLAGINSRLTVIALAAAPVLAVCSLLLGRRAQQAKGQERELESLMESHVQQTLTGIRVVQTFAQEGREQARFRHLAGLAQFAKRRSVLISALSVGSAGLTTTLAGGVILGLGAHEVVSGRLTLGQLLVFLAYLSTLNTQLSALAGSYTTGRGVWASLDRVLHVLDAHDDIRERPRAITLKDRPLSVAFENVTFGYLPGRPVLRGVSFEIPAGATVAIVGPTGAGKSTIAALVPRLADVGEGRVLVGGYDVRDLSLLSLRSAVAVVPQDPMLFADTIAANIALGRPDATLDELHAATRAAALGPVIAGLPGGYNAVLGERGGTLSGGERQRLAIARALLRAAPILILDEPTSGLDAATEAELLREVLCLRAGQTTLLIAHRLSTVRRADLIVVVEGGIVAEAGTHGELLRRGGLYAALWAASAAPAAGRIVSEESLA